MVFDQLNLRAPAATYILAGLVVLGVILRFALLANAADGGYKVGDRVANFTLKNVDGKTVALEDYKTEKGVIVVFTCNHCPFSQMYEDRLIAINNKYAGKGYPVLAINPNDTKKQPEDSFTEMQKRAGEKKYTFAYLHDDKQDVAKAFGAVRTPQVFLLSRRGSQFALEYIGAIDDNANEASDARNHYVDQAIDKLMQGQKPEPATTKAIGCTIKWREV